MKDPVMKRLYLFTMAAWCLAFATLGFTATEQMPSPAADSEQAQVIEVMRAFYVAATNDDLAKFHTVVTDDFYSYDGGKRFSGDELMELIKAAHAAGKVYVWNVTKPEVHVHGDAAWITYVNEGSVTDTSGTKNVTWLESAFLRREKGSWRIAFFHSTRVP
jgi:ketosteroid isomerase-like protein